MCATNWTVGVLSIVLASCEADPDHVESTAMPASVAAVACLLDEPIRLGPGDWAPNPVRNIFDAARFEPAPRFAAPGFDPTEDSVVLTTFPLLNRGAIADLIGFKIHVDGKGIVMGMPEEVSGFEATGSQGRGDGFNFIESRLLWPEAPRGDEVAPEDWPRQDGSRAEASVRIQLRPPQGGGLEIYSLEVHTFDATLGAQTLCLKRASKRPR